MRQHSHSQFEPASILTNKQEQHSIDGNRIRLARESRGLTQADLAKLVNVSTALVSRWELHSSDPSSEIEFISEALNYPIEFFSTEKIFMPSILSHLYRKTSSMSIKDKKIVEAKAYIRVDQISRIIAKWANFNWGLPSHNPDEATPEEIAIRTRFELKIGRGPIENLTKIIESRGIFVFLEKFEDSELDGITIRKDGIPPAIFLNSERPGERIRFTLAHELGHLIMHEFPREEMEDEANRFASEFLMPMNDISDDLHDSGILKFSALKQYWKVSIQALIYRAQSLDIISKQQAKNLFIEIGRRGWRKNEPNPLPQELPALTQLLISHIIKETNLSANEIAQAIGSSAEDFAIHFQRKIPKFGVIYGKA